MTREEAIKVLKMVECHGSLTQKAKEMAISALSAEPCEDCISREETLTAFSDYVGGGMSMNDFDALWDIVEKMPSVQPIRPKGKWFDVGSLSCRCSECGCKNNKENNFCSNCGADMRGDQ